MDLAPGSWDAREKPSFLHHFTDLATLKESGATIIEMGRSRTCSAYFPALPSA
jgi:hypothetical protein